MFGYAEINTEEEFYAALKLPFIEPKEREREFLANLKTSVASVAEKI